jgi:hypothetical protein
MSWWNKSNKEVFEKTAVNLDSLGQPILDSCGLPARFIVEENMYMGVSITIKESDIWRQKETGKVFIRKWLK